MAENFLSQLVQSGALNVPNPMESYKNALTMKKFQMEMEGAPLEKRAQELDVESKLISVGKAYLGRVKDRSEYPKFRSYMVDQLGANPELFPESFETDEEFEDYRIQATASADELIKLRRGQPVTMSVPILDDEGNETGQHREIEVKDQAQLKTLQEKGLIPENAVLGKIRGTRQKPKTPKEEAEEAIAKSEGLGARIGENIPGEELERIVMEGEAGERFLERAGAAKPEYQWVKTPEGELIEVEKGKAPAGAVPYEKSRALSLYDRVGIHLFKEQYDAQDGKQQGEILDFIQKNKEKTAALIGGTAVERQIDVAKKKQELAAEAPTATKDIPKEVDARLSVLARGYNIGDVLGPQEKDVQAWFRVMRPLYTQYYKDLNAGKEVVEPEPLTPRQAGAIEAQQRIAPMVRERAKGDRKKAKALFLREMTKEGYTEGTDYTYKD